MTQSVTTEKPKQRKIGVRTETFEKFQRIAKSMRRTLAETADVMADDYLKNEEASSPPEIPDGKQNQPSSV